MSCDYCNNPLYVGTKCKNCGREPAPVQEPVAWVMGNDIYWHENPDINDYIRQNGEPLYTTPPAQPAVPEGWQPIETAPKDFCTEFDGWNGKRVPDVYWAKPEFNSKGNYAWCVQQYEHGYGSVNIEVNGLTHWRPIPAAPTKVQP